ncbi:MAG: DUF4126 domain-containing protein [Chthoniobacter sp.]|nr:DUF4126 domain-containing protein [Chthoniobacter sp.]
MHTLQLLAVALGLASLAGINLYLTVFASGLAIQQHWIDVSQTYPELVILGHPAIVIISGVLFFLQFFADKVPWVDSLWDTVHTVIRPVGGAFLAIRVLGNPDPVFDVVAALLAGGVTLMTHSVKAGTRLVVNHSPEPFSNIAVSLTEDAAVLGGLALVKYSIVHSDPWLLLSVFGTILLCIAYFGPKLFRAVRANAWLVWKKLSSPAADHVETELPATLPHELEIAFATVNPAREAIAWAVPCLSTSARNIPGNCFGYLVATKEPTPKLVFLAKRRFRHLAEELDLTTYKVAHEPKFLSENVVLYSLEKKPKYVFAFARSQRPLVKGIATSLRMRLGFLAPTPESVPAPAAPAGVA